MVFSLYSKVKDGMKQSTEAVLVTNDGTVLQYIYNECTTYKFQLFIWPVCVVLSRNLPPVTSLDNTSNVISYVIVSEGCK